jgi:glyoxylate reductase
MNKKKVFITRLIPEKAISFLKDECEVYLNMEDRSLTKEEIIKAVKGMDAVMTMSSNPIDADVLEAAGGQCRIFSNYAVGYNNIDIPAATARGIYVTNTPDVLTNATADMAWALLMSCARRVVESDALVRAGKFKGNAPLFMLGMEITGKTLGIIGPGRIGTAFARKASGFDMKVLYSSRSRKPEFEKETGGSYVALDTLLNESDFISIHAPLTNETRHLISTRELKMMKKTAVIVNTSRGPIIDENALAAALKEGTIWGAGLDVYENEPEVDQELIGLSNVVLSPHIGSATFETKEKIGYMAGRNILAALRGEVPPQCLNPDAGKNRR